MKPRILKTEADYENALDRVIELGDPEPGTSKGDELELLLLLIEDYEAKYIEPIPDPHPVAVIQFMMDELNLKRSDLGKLINSKSHASEILDYKRPLSLNHIRLISAKWSIPADVLIQKYDTEGKRGRSKHQGKRIVTGRRIIVSKKVITKSTKSTRGLANG